MLLLRHGESVWNAEGRWQGWEDVALTERGEEQARIRARRLAADGAGFAAVSTSDLRRARRTAEIIAEHLGIGPARAAEGFRERHGGEWQGHTGADIDDRWPGLRNAWRRGELAAPPGGETDAAVLARFDESLGLALAGLSGDGALLVVTHHGLLRLVTTRAGVPVTTTIPNLGGRWFEHDGTALVAGETLGPLDGEDAPDGE